MAPPYKPQLDSQTDTKHFLDEFTKMQLSPLDSESLKNIQTDWKEFDFQDNDAGQIYMDQAE